MGWNVSERPSPQSEPTQTVEKKKKENETVPESNKAAEVKAKGQTEKAKQKGSEKIKEKKEKKEKKKPVVITICGRTITRIKKESGYVFKEKGSQTPITNLSVWIKERMKDPKIKETIDTHLASYQRFFKKLEEGKRKELIGRLNATSFSKIEYGKIDVYGKKVENPTQKAAYIASIVGRVTNGGKLSVVQKALEKSKHKRYLDYQHILPPQVRTIIVTRGEKEFVCSRKIGAPEKGGRVSYTDVSTGKRVCLRANDTIQIVGTVPVGSKEYKRAVQAEQTYARIRAQRGKTWEKDSDKVVDLKGNKRSSSKSKSSASVSSGPVAPSSGTELSSNYASTPSSTPSSTQPVGPSDTISSSSESNAGETLGSLPSLVENPEEMNKHCSQETFNLPGNHLFGSMLRPDPKKYPKLKKKKPKLILYFAGRGHYKAIKEWYKKHGSEKKPPPRVLAKAAREDFLSGKKRIFSMLKEQWAKGENVHFVLVSHMRSYLHPTDNGAAKYWYREFAGKNSANSVLQSVVGKYKKATGTKEVKNITLAGHSMGGKALAGLSRLKSQGEIPYTLSYFASDATYWHLKLDHIKKNPKTALFVSYRPGTKTEKIARSIIAQLGLKPTKNGKETLYKSDTYPHVTVVASSVSHAQHPGYYLKPAWELAQRAQTGKTSVA